VPTGKIVADVSKGSTFETSATIYQSIRLNVTEGSWVSRNVFQHHGSYSLKYHAVCELIAGPSGRAV